MKKAIIAFFVLAILAAGGYWGWNAHTINKLRNELSEVAAAQSTSADAQDLLQSSSRLVTLSRTAADSKLPLFTERYEAIESECASLLKHAPSSAAHWIKTNRAKATSSIGSAPDDTELIDTIRKLKSVCDTGIAAQDRIITCVKDLGIQLTSVEGMPQITSEVETTATRSAELLKRAPSAAAERVKNNRANAWSSIGSELSPKDRLSDTELIDAVRRLKSVCDTGIAAQDRIITAAKDLGIQPSTVKDMPLLATEVETTATQAAELAEVGQRIAKIKREARALVQEGLRAIDLANRDIEKYPELRTLRKVCTFWEAARFTIGSSRSTLSSLPSFKKSHQSKTAAALVTSDLSKINEMVSKVDAHVRMARSELAKAERQESTVAGRAKRTVGRLFNRAKEKFSQSRIGREVTVSFKTMVLGTKMFYDMMDINSSSDIKGWAIQYEGDMDQLMNEVDEVRKMDGWSLTGKNTFIEDLTDKAYQESFDKK